MSNPIPPSKVKAFSIQLSGDFVGIVHVAGTEYLYCTKIPDFVFDAMNALIMKNFDGKQAIVNAMTAMNVFDDLSDGHVIILHEGWDAIYAAYRGAGWVIETPGPSNIIFGKATA